MKRRKKAILTLLSITAALGFVAGFSCGRMTLRQSTKPIVNEVPLQEIGDDNELYADELDSDMTTDTVPPLTPDSSSVYDTYLDEMPNNSCVRLKVNPIGGSLGRVFNDSNHIHLAEAEKIGIHPISNPTEAWQLRRPICRIRSSANFVVDNLTHSYPYLVPEAADLLNEIGSRFNDSLVARGGGSYRIKVTSLLRTSSTIRQLRRRNTNAISASAHQYGTTFDISYVNFICDRSTSTNRTQQDLKNLLGEILSEMRQEQKCYVKYERKQGCFHITARVVDDNQTDSES
ncbi:MAG: DUF5715 family protein [Muribaculum sp.]|nr:DUF5715 family protein [Muribaculaceae bacterium]MCM1080803.1 DUF5715 family protein [Muribaculum sp.]